MAEKKKRPGWTHPRHRLVEGGLSALMKPYTCWKYNLEIVPFREEKKRPVLIIFNHQTGWDQFFVSMAFKAPVYFIASEDIFSLGSISRALSWLVAPIPIKKQTSDLRAVRNAMQAAREGGSIALAPEGNRTFDGTLCYIKPAILGLIRLLKLPVVTFRIEGGFGVHPRWSDVLRKGKMKAYPSRVIEPEEYKALNDEELMALLLSELNVNEACISGEFHSDKSAEYLERALYVCPDCGLTEFESIGQIMTCKKCGLTVRYLPDKTFERVGRPDAQKTEVRNADVQKEDGTDSAADFPFRFIADWYRYQGDYVRSLDLEPYYEAPMHQCAVRFSRVILYNSKKLLAENASLTLYGNRIVLSAETADFTEELGTDTIEWSFNDIDTITVLGKNKLNIYKGGLVYQVKPDKRFNALRYVNMFYHYKAIAKGENDGKQFLGL